MKVISSQGPEIALGLGEVIHVQYEGTDYESYVVYRGFLFRLIGRSTDDVILYEKIGNCATIPYKGESYDASRVV